MSPIGTCPEHVLTYYSGLTWRGGEEKASGEILLDLHLFFSFSRILHPSTWRKGEMPFQEGEPAPGLGSLFGL